LADIQTDIKFISHRNRMSTIEILVKFSEPINCHPRY
jgi:hypothetical protein